MTASPIDLSHIGVLYLEDDRVMRSIVRAALHQQGCRDIVLADGCVQAVEVCTTRDFDLVICDYQVGDMTGLEFLQALCERGKGAGWSIIMLSSDDDASHVEAARAMGVRAWLRKPVSAQRLIDQIARSLALTPGLGPMDGNPAETDRYTARVIAAASSVEHALTTIAFRGSQRLQIWRALDQTMQDIAGMVAPPRFRLIPTLARRAHTLLGVVSPNATVFEQAQPQIVQLLGVMAGTMKRIAGSSADTAEHGQALLARLDAVAAPLHARLARAAAEAQTPLAAPETPNTPNTR